MAAAEAVVEKMEDSLRKEEAFPKELPGGLPETGPETRGQETGGLQGPETGGLQGPETGGLQGSETGGLQGPETGSQLGPETGSQLGPETGSQLGLETDSQQGPDSGGQLGPETGGQLGPETGGQLGPETGGQQGPETGGQPGPETGGQLGSEMGAEALVCHEVDLDDDEKERAVCASEQLLLMMTEGHLREAPPTAHLREAPPTPVKTTPTAAGGGFQERGAKEPTLGNIGADEENSHSPTCDRGQKRVMEENHSPTMKKHKRHRRPVPKNGAGHSSDSEDQRISEKPHKHCPSPGHKWSLHIDDLEKMSSSERISFLQEKLQEIRKYYLSLKSEVASIDRRRKRLKKKEREVSNTASASSSSDAGMSPSSSSPSQSSLAVEVR